MRPRMRSWNGARPTAAPPAGRRSTTTCFDLATRSDGRSAIALHQRTCPRNIQKDGTFSVIPQMKGGDQRVRTAPHCRCRRQVRRAHAQGHRRAAHRPARNKEEDLVDVWKDLGMQSGHAYGKSIRTVKTCVGSEFAVSARRTARRWHRPGNHAGQHVEPAQGEAGGVRLPAHCAESGIRTWAHRGGFGLEIHSDGNGGSDRVAKFLVKVKPVTRCASTAAPSCSVPRRSLLPGSQPCITIER